MSEHVKIRCFVFMFPRWDNRPDGWDTFAGVVAADNIEAIREWIAEKNNGPNDADGNDYYQIVDADRLVLVERGCIHFDYASDGNTVINSRVEKAAD